VVEFFSAEGAVERSGPIMKVDVSLQGELVVKLLATGGAGIAGCCVHFEVLLKVALHLELLITDTAHKSLSFIIHFMCSCMFQEKGTIRKFLVTDLTLKGFVSSVHPYMLLQV
jgi:hypothetical protein